MQPTSKKISVFPLLLLIIQQERQSVVSRQGAFKNDIQKLSTLFDNSLLSGCASFNKLVCEWLADTLWGRQNQPQNWCCLHKRAVLGSRAGVQSPVFRKLVFAKALRLQPSPVDGDALWRKAEAVWCALFSFYLSRSGLHIASCSIRLSSISQKSKIRKTFAKYSLS